MSKFYHLHVHSEFSVLDSTIKIDNLLKRCNELNMDAVAITDFGNIFASYIFYSKAKKASIKPIIGCEVFVSPRSMKHKTLKDYKRHTNLILLVKNKQGFENLNKLIELSYSDGLYYKPRVDKEALSQYSEGLIALSSNIKGEIPQLIIQGKSRKAEKTARFFKNIFGQDNFFLEIQDHGMLIQKKINSSLFDMGEKLSIPLVATNDCRYLLKKDCEAYYALISHQMENISNNSKQFNLDFGQFYLKSSKEMIKTFHDYPEALKNTERIFLRCNLNIKKSDFLKHERNFLNDDSMVERFTFHKPFENAGGIFKINDPKINALFKPK